MKNTLILMLMMIATMAGATNVTNYPVRGEFQDSDLFLASSIADKTNYNVTGADLRRMTNGLGSAAFTSASAYDAAGAGDNAVTNADVVGNNGICWIYFASSQQIEFNNVGDGLFAMFEGPSGHEALHANGSAITNLNASQLTSGTVPLAQLPVYVVTNVSGTVTATTFSGALSGNATSATSATTSSYVTQSPLTNAVTNYSGTIGLAQLPGSVVTNGFGQRLNITYLQVTNGAATNCSIDASGNIIGNSESLAAGLNLGTATVNTTLSLVGGRGTIFMDYGNSIFSIYSGSGKSLTLGANGIQNNVINVAADNSTVTSLIPTWRFSGTLTATNGFACYSTNRTTVTATGYTNTLTINAVPVDVDVYCTGASIVLTDQNNVTMHTFTTPSVEEYHIHLHPKWAVVGTGMAGDVIAH